jgi:hypothetical protein
MPRVSTREAVRNPSTTIAIAATSGARLTAILRLRSHNGSATAESSGSPKPNAFFGVT